MYWDIEGLACIRVLGHRGFGVCVKVWCVYIGTFLVCTPH